MLAGGVLEFVAKRGLSVFPVATGAKTPAVANWPERASADTWALIENWPAHASNYGVKCGEIVVIDADAHKGGLTSLATLGDLPATFTVNTPNGGKHLYFRSPAGSRFGNSVEKLAPGIDVRASGGYVVGPGSVVDGKTYTVENDAPIAELPAWLAERLNAAPRKTAEPGAAIGTVDGAAAIEAARTWLLGAPPAIEGEGGNALAYATACRVLDFGVSPETAVELMGETWNETCSPAWDVEDLERIVGNAARYRQDAIGRDNPELGFEEIDPLPPRANGFAAKLRRFDLTQAKVDALPPRPWLAKRRLLQGKVTIIVAPGGSGKSFVMLEWAAALALGNGDFCGLELAAGVGPSGVVVINNEDEDAEFDRRLGAIFQRFGLDFDAASERLFTYSGVKETFLAAVRAAKSGRIEGSQEFEDLTATVIDLGIRCVFFDPLVSLHQANENDNAEMNSVMRMFTRLAAVTNCAVCIAHHTNKPSVAGSDNYAGNANVGRGASSIKDAARIQLTLFGMSEKDAERYGVPEYERHEYVRLDDAKANLYLAAGVAEWFRKTPVQLAGGEEIGVFVPVRFDDQASKEGAVFAGILAPHLKTSLSVKRAAELVKLDSAYSAETAAELRRKIVDAFQAGPVQFEGRTFRLYKRGRDGGDIRAV